MDLKGTNQAGTIRKRTNDAQSKSSEKIEWSITNGYDKRLLMTLYTCKCKVSINADEIYKGGTCNGDVAPIHSAD